MTTKQPRCTVCGNTNPDNFYLKASKSRCKDCKRKERKAERKSDLPEYLVEALVTPVEECDIQIDEENDVNVLLKEIDRLRADMVESTLDHKEEQKKLNEQLSTLENRVGRLEIELHQKSGPVKLPTPSLFPPAPKLPVPAPSLLPLAPTFLPPAPTLPFPGPSLLPGQSLLPPAPTLPPSFVYKPNSQISL